MKIDIPFYFLRHGETDWNKDKIVQGQMDIQLNETGRAQAIRAAEILRDEPLEHIVASPLSRARDTAKAVALRHNIEITYDDGLMECHLGTHQGELQGDWTPGYWAGEYHPEGGESFQQFCQRVHGAMQRATALGPNTLIVAHGGLWLAAKAIVQVKPDMRRMPNAQPMLIKPENGVWHHTTLG